MRGRPGNPSAVTQTTAVDGTLALSGDLDLATVGDVHAVLVLAIDDHPGVTIRVDMAEVTFVDSTGLGTLVAANHRAARTGGRVELINVTDEVEQVFQMTGLDRLFIVPRP